MSKREFLFYSSLIEQSRYMTQFFKVLNKGFFFFVLVSVYDCYGGFEHNDNQKMLMKGRGRFQYGNMIWE